MNANFRQKLERKKNEKYENEKIQIFEFGNAFEYSLEIRIFECSNYSNVRIFVLILSFNSIWGELMFLAQ